VDVLADQLRMLRSTAVNAQAEGLSAGDIVIRLSGTCGAGFAENTDLANRVLRGTTIAAGDAAGTGGSDTITPAGTNSGGAVDAHAGAAVADHASHTHTYTDVLNHTHTITVTDPGHTHVEQQNTATTGGLTGWAAPDTSTNTAAATGYSTQSNTTGITAASANPGGGVATGTTAGPGATLTHSVTQPSAHTFTQPTFTGTQFSNLPAYTKVLFCQKS
jgi:hypothetical protein